jgi:sugar lactone lactonase YvrE
MNNTFELVVDSRSILGEGAVWDHRKKKLYWVDIEKGLLHVYDPNTGVNTSHALGSRVCTVVPVQNGGLLLALEDGIAMFDPITRALDVVVPLDLSEGEARLNDGKCDPSGRFWVGTLSSDRHPHSARLFRIESDFTAKTVLRGVDISNGMAWSRCARAFYHIDTPTRTVAAFDYDAATGEIWNGRVVIRTPTHLGWPDGMTMDSMGKLWIAMFGGSCVTVWEPATGELLDSIEIPAKNVTSCAFGGEDLNELYITTAQIELTESERARSPRSGGLFRKRVDSHGIPANEYVA